MEDRKRKGKPDGANGVKPTAAVRSQEAPLSEPPAALKVAYSLDSLMQMGRDELLASAKKACGERGISEVKDFATNPELAPLRMAITKKGLLRELFAPSPAPGNNVDSADARAATEFASDDVDISDAPKADDSIDDGINNVLSVIEARQASAAPGTVDLGDPAVEAVPAAPAPNLAPLPLATVVLPRPATPLKRPSRVKRFLTSPFTWTVATIGMVSYALFSTDAFQVIATGINGVMESHKDVSAVIRDIWETKLHLPPLDSVKGVISVFYGLTGLGFLASMISNYLTKRRMAKHYAGISAERLDEAHDYAIRKLASIAKVAGRGPAISRAIQEELRGDETLFDALDILSRDAKVFVAAMQEAKLSNRMVNRMGGLLTEAETDVVLARLNPYLGASPEDRPAVLQSLFDSDPLLRRKLDEMFRTQEYGSAFYRAKKIRLEFAMGGGMRGQENVSIIRGDYLLLDRNKYLQLDRNRSRS
ncbi:MAG: hypothetical protein PHF60_00215 [Candidatus ainarchaeum sp.]|nr:hypothetical protein [Candidatus ainarchaeum sp.]